MWFRSRWRDSRKGERKIQNEGGFDGFLRAAHQLFENFPDGTMQFPMLVYGVLSNPQATNCTDRLNKSLPYNKLIYIISVPSGKIG